MKKSLSTLALCALLTPVQALASELGMTSSVGYSYRTGTGSAATYFQTNTQVGETTYFGATRTNNPSATESEINRSSGARTLTESTLTTGRLEETFSFGNTSRNSFVGVFTR